MERVNSRISQAYGYAVCFITVVVMLIAIKSVVDAAFDLSDPLRAEGGGYGRLGRPLTSFDLYKVEARRQTGTRYPSGSTVTIAEGESNTPRNVVMDTTSSEADLRKLYDAERDAAIGNARFHAMRSLVGNLLLIALAGTLFAVHWRWLRRRDALPLA
jgi:uncharacterized protein (DUF1330 family)